MFQTPRTDASIPLCSECMQAYYSSMGYSHFMAAGHGFELDQIDKAQLCKCNCSALISARVRKATAGFTYVCQNSTAASGPMHHCMCVLTVLMSVTDVTCICPHSTEQPSMNVLCLCAQLSLRVSSMQEGFHQHGRLVSRSNYDTFEKC